MSESFVTIEQGRQKVQGAPELDPNILLQPNLGARSMNITATQFLPKG